MTREENILKIEQQKADVQTLLDIPAGRRFIQRVIDEGRITKVMGSSDAYNTGFFDGQRSLALKVVEFVNEADPGRMVLAVGNQGVKCNV